MAHLALLVIAAVFGVSSAQYAYSPYYAHAPAVAVAHAPVAVAHAPVAAKIDEYDPHPQYQYSYSVNDATTGDAKTQTEARDGDVVQGSYSLLEADGSRRIVDYTADPVNGFNAVVHKEAGAHAVAAAPVAAAPLAYAARPALAYAARPALAYAARPAYAYGAPLAYAARSVLPSVNHAAITLH